MSGCSGVVDHASRLRAGGCAGRGGAGSLGRSRLGAAGSLARLKALVDAVGLAGRVLRRLGPPQVAQPLAQIAEPRDEEPARGRVARSERAQEVDRLLDLDDSLLAAAALAEQDAQVVESCCERRLQLVAMANDQRTVQVDRLANDLDGFARRVLGLAQLAPPQGEDMEAARQERLER